MLCNNYPGCGCPTIRLRPHGREYIDCIEPRPKRRRLMPCQTVAPTDNRNDHYDPLSPLKNLAIGCIAGGIFFLVCVIVSLMR